jgi:hypothetical protein
MLFPPVPGVGDTSLWCLSPGARKHTDECAFTLNYARVSLNEVCFAAEHAERYYLYRVYDFDEELRGGSLYVQRGALANVFDLTVIQFRASVNGVPAT